MHRVGPQQFQKKPTIQNKKKRHSIFYSCHVFVCKKKIFAETAYKQKHVILKLETVEILRKGASAAVIGPNQLLTKDFSVLYTVHLRSALFSLHETS